MATTPPPGSRPPPSGAPPGSTPTGAPPAGSRPPPTGAPPGGPPGAAGTPPPGSRPPPSGAPAAAPPPGAAAPPPGAAAPPQAGPTPNRPPPGAAPGPSPATGPAPGPSPAPGPRPVAAAPPGANTPAANTQSTAIALPPRRTTADTNPRNWAEFPFPATSNFLEAQIEIEGVNYANYERLRETDPGRRQQFDVELHEALFQSMRTIVAPQDVWIAVVPGVVSQVLLKFEPGQNGPTSLIDAEWSMKVHVYVKCLRADERDIRRSLEQAVMTSATATNVLRLYIRHFGGEGVPLRLRWGFLGQNPQVPQARGTPLRVQNDAMSRRERIEREEEESFYDEDEEYDDFPRGQRRVVATRGTPRRTEVVRRVVEDVEEDVVPYRRADDGYGQRATPRRSSARRQVVEEEYDDYVADDGYGRSVRSGRRGSPERIERSSARRGLPPPARSAGRGRYDDGLIDDGPSDDYYGPPQRYSPRSATTRRNGPSNYYDDGSDDVITVSEVRYY